MQHAASISCFTVQDQSPYFNALSIWRLIAISIFESGMWHTPRHGRIRVEALDQHHLIRLLFILEEPSMS